MSSFRIALASGVALCLLPAGVAVAAPSVSVSVFATGAAVNSTSPDSVAIGNGSVWIEYGNGANATGGAGSSTIVRYSQSTGAVQNTFSIAGSVDGLNIDPSTGTVYALQNQDGNSTLSTINPATNVVSGPRQYATSSTMRGYDEFAFRNGQVFGSYTNPANPTDSVINRIDIGANPLTATPVLAANATGTNLATGQTQSAIVNDPDSLKVRPNGDLQLTSGDDATITFVHNPLAADQSVSFLQLTDAGGTAIGGGLDDVVTATSSSGTFYLADTSRNNVLRIDVTGLTPGSLYADIGTTHALEFVDPSTGAVTPLVSGLGSPHGLAFVPSVPEPATLALFGTALAGLLGLRRRAR